MPSLPRCPCGCYTVIYARRVGHVCQIGDEWPVNERAVAVRLRAATLRAEGKKLQEIGAELGVTGERARQLIEASGVPLCPKCKRPSDRVRSTKGIVPQCSLCHAKMMAERPSKAARRTGYRTNPWAHQRAHVMRLAKEGLTVREIAERLGLSYRGAWNRIEKMRKEGKDVPIVYGGRGPTGNTQV
jgi:transposase-like protein